MTGLLAILALGFFLGMRHATDADHIIAVSTIVTRNRNLRGAALIGVAWGVGHTITIVIVGVAIIAFRWVIPARLGLSMELAVGVMLIVLGLLNLTGVLRKIGRLMTRGRPRPAQLHSHPHTHGDYIHDHVHGHEPDAHPHAADQTPLGRIDRWLGVLGGYQLIRPLVVGVVHGLAGSAAIALLVLTTIREPIWSIVYLALFGVGTIVGMMLITAAIALPFAFSGRFERVSQGLRVASGLLSLGFGLLIAYRIGFVDGLFRANPLWTPR